MEIKYDKSKCKGVGECLKGSPEVFAVVDNKLVIEASKGTDESIRATVAKCPTGALTCED